MMINASKILQTLYALVEEQEDVKINFDIREIEEDKTSVKIELDLTEEKATHPRKKTTH